MSYSEISLFFDFFSIFTSTLLPPCRVEYQLYYPLVELMLNLATPLVELMISKTFNENRYPLPIDVVF